MPNSLDVVSVNLWQILISLANLVVMFLIVKHFFYKKVKAMLQARRQAIENDYEAARTAKEQAMADKAAYEARLKDAGQEADSVIRNAVAIADAREQEMLAAAKAKADGIVRRAEEQAALERKKAEDDIKREIVSVSSLLTEKVLEREVSADDHRRLIDSFIESMGDDNAAN